MPNFSFTVNMFVQDNDTDLVENGAFSDAMRDRFEGTAIHIISVIDTTVAPKELNPDDMGLADTKKYLQDNHDMGHREALDAMMFALKHGQYVITGYPRETLVKDKTTQKARFYIKLGE